MMRMPKRFAAVLMLLLACAVCPVAHAQFASGANDDARVRAIASTLRCLVCQNQTLADSNADLAADLRERIREQVRAGATDDDIRAYMVRRYGDFVLYQPPLKPVTWLLWFGPFIALVAAALALFAGIRRRRHVRACALDAQERAQMHALLADTDEGPTR
ncbi:cytochrome c-type biogenesis protein [Paraburkholderia dinghuensis]